MRGTTTLFTALGTSTAATLLLTLTACGVSAPEESSGGGETPPAQETQEARETTSQQSQQGQESDAASADVAVDAVDASQVLAEQEYEPTRAEGTVTFGLHSLTVEGETMTLRVVITPQLEVDDETITLSDIFGIDRFAPTLIDREHLKEYSIITDGPTEWWQASDLETTTGESMVWWGVYAAPEDDVDAVDVRLRDDMPEFSDVPVEGAS